MTDLSAELGIGALDKAIESLAETANRIADNHNTLRDFVRRLAKADVYDDTGATISSSWKAEARELLEELK